MYLCIISACIIHSNVNSRSVVKLVTRKELLHPTPLFTCHGFLNLIIVKQQKKNDKKIVFFSCIHSIHILFLFHSQLLNSVQYILIFFRSMPDIIFWLFHETDIQYYDSCIEYTNGWVFFRSDNNVELCRMSSSEKKKQNLIQTIHSFFSQYHYINKKVQNIFSKNPSFYFIYFYFRCYCYRL